MSTRCARYYRAHLAGGLPVPRVPPSEIPARPVLFHVKHGREHCHVVWSRIDVDQKRAVHLAFDHDKLMRVTRIPINCAAGISVRSDSRYDEPVTIPTKSEIKALLKAADDLSNAKNQTVAKPWQRYRPMLYLAVDSGMRPQEYLAVARSSLAENGIKVERAIDGDGNRISVTKTPTGRRFIDLTDTTINMVRHYAENIAAPNDHDLIFPDKSGRWQCRRNWQRRGFDVACEKAGLMVEQDAGGGEKISVPKFRPYDLRHFFASYHIDKGTNLKKLQKMMGTKTSKQRSMCTVTFWMMTKNGQTVSLAAWSDFSCGECVATGR